MLQKLRFLPEKNVCELQLRVNPKGFFVFFLGKLGLYVYLDHPVSEWLINGVTNHVNYGTVGVTTKHGY